MASKYVVTAAHCMFFEEEPLLASDVKVRIGDHNLATTEETTIEKTIGVANIYNHEDYDENDEYSNDNDISVLELSEELDLNTYAPACLAQTSDTDTFNGKMAQVYGWGDLWCNGHIPDKLMEVSVPVVNNTQCSKSMDIPGDYPRIFPGSICAGGEGKDSCQVSKKIFYSS